MQAVILAAGEGKRRWPLTGAGESAIPVASTDPRLSYPCASGKRDPGYHHGGGLPAGTCIRHLNRMDLPVKVVIQQKQLGTADALKCAGTS